MSLFKLKRSYLLVIISCMVSAISITASNQPYIPGGICLDAHPPFLGVYIKLVNGLSLEPYEIELLGDKLDRLKVYLAERTNVGSFYAVKLRNGVLESIGKLSVDFSFDADDLNDKQIIARIKQLQQSMAPLLTNIKTRDFFLKESKKPQSSKDILNQLIQVIYDETGFAPTPFSTSISDFLDPALFQDHNKTEHGIEYTARIYQMPYLQPIYEDQNTYIHYQIKRPSIEEIVNFIASAQQVIKKRNTFLQKNISIRSKSTNAKMRETIKGMISRLLPVLKSPHAQRKYSLYEHQIFSQVEYGNCALILTGIITCLINELYFINLCNPVLAKQYQRLIKKKIKTTNICKTLDMLLAKVDIDEEAVTYRLFQSSLEDYALIVEQTLQVFEECASKTVAETDSN